MKKTLFAVLSITLFYCATQNMMAQNALLKEANEQFEQFAFPKAIELYAKVLEKDRDNAQALANIADCYRLTSDTRKAELYYKKAIKANKDKHALKLYYAQSMMSNKNYDNALEVFEEYTRLVPHDSRGWNFADYCRNINEYMRDSLMYNINRLVVSCTQSDISPAFFADGIVFASARPKGLIDKKSEWTGESLYDIFYTKETVGSWSTPEPLAGKPESQYDEGQVTFNAQNTVMYFTRNMGKSKAKNGTARLGIFQANKIDNKWTNVKEMSFNNESYSVGHPTITPDGKTLYFTSDMPNGMGGKDIYMSQYKGGSWSKPENLGASVNTEGDEMFPFVHADGTLYFASNGWGGFGGLDVFAAKPFQEDWMITNVGYPINSSRDDFGFILNENKTVGYISSNRNARTSDDIYKISIQPAKAKQMRAKYSDLVLVSDQPNVITTVINDNIPATSVPTVPAQQTAWASSPDRTYSPQLEDSDIAQIAPKQNLAKTHTNMPSMPMPNNPPKLGDRVSFVYGNGEAATVQAMPKPLDQSPGNGYKQKTVKKDPILAEEPQLVLMGIVVNKINNQPLSNAVVSLTDSDTKEEIKVVTSDNGNFIFKLNCQKNYVLSKLFGERQEDMKKISTINKCNPEMLHAILTGTPSGAVYRGSAIEDPKVAPKPAKQPKNYLEERAAEEPKNYIPPTVTNVSKNEQVSQNVANNMDGLIFKIQIGSFSHFRSTAHAFFDGVRSEINSGKLKIENKDGLTRYIIGIYGNYEEAEKVRQNYLTKYPDAYVSAYINGYRIEKPIEEILAQYK